jgi:hypothetical protein
MRGRARFERNQHGFSGSRFHVRPNYEHPGAFLGRLWALFGSPDVVGEGGFRYSLRDRETGLAFDAYSGASGPAYAVEPQDRASSEPVLVAFNAVVDNLEPVDCEIEYEDDEWGRYRVGVYHGHPFQRPVALTPPQLVHAIEEADAERAANSDDPWEYLGALQRLDIAWARTPPEDRANLESQARGAAVALFEAALEAGLRLSTRPPDAQFRVPFVDAGLDTLRELASSALLDDLDGTEVERRVSELAARFNK